jgi:hypothetical protein
MMMMMMMMMMMLMMMMMMMMMMITARSAASHCISPPPEPLYCDTTNSTAPRSSIMHPCGGVLVSHSLSMNTTTVI